MFLAITLGATALLVIITAKSAINWRMRKKSRAHRALTEALLKAGLSKPSFRFVDNTDWRRATGEAARNNARVCFRISPKEENNKARLYVDDGIRKWQVEISV